MENRFFFIVLCFFLFQSLDTKAQKSGEELFKTTCFACHTINGGRLVGPDLAGINERRDPEWLIKFIHSSQKMIKDGDPVAIDQFNKYGKITMPDNNFSDKEIRNILDYIKSNEKDVASASVKDVLSTDTTLAKTEIVYDQDLLNKGQALFYGYEKFTNGASSCNACHYIKDESIAGGGNLSLDLTEAFTKLGKPGIHAILSNPPFPAMNTALYNKELTDNEKEAIISMLQYVNDQNLKTSYHPEKGLIFFVLSFVLAIFVLINIYLLYDYRKIPSK